MVRTILTLCGVPEAQHSVRLYGGTRVLVRKARAPLRATAGLAPKRRTPVEGNHLSHRRLCQDGRAQARSTLDSHSIVVSLRPILRAYAQPLRREPEDDSCADRPCRRYHAERASCPLRCAVTKCRLRPIPQESCGFAQKSSKRAWEDLPPALLLHQTGPALLQGRHGRSSPRIQKSSHPQNAGLLSLSIPDLP